MKTLNCRYIAAILKMQVLGFLKGLSGEGIGEGCSRRHVFSVRELEKGNVEKKSTWKVYQLFQ